MVWHTCTSHITTLHVASRCILNFIYCSSNMKFVFISYQHIHFCDTHANVLIIIDHHISFIFAIYELLQLHDVHVCNQLENSYQGVLSFLAILLQWNIYIFYIFYKNLLISLNKSQKNLYKNLNNILAYCSNSLLA